MSGTTHLRPTRGRNFDALSRRASRAVVGLSALICLPVIVVAVLISRTSGPDLFDLIPKDPNIDGYTLLAWYDLDRGRQSLKEGGTSTGARMRALGYMMNGDQPVRDGQIVRRVVLLPDKGTAMHPAHRFGDEMIDVQLQPGDNVRYSGGSLVWVWGTLRGLPGDTGRPIPLYQLENARVEPATEAEIPKYIHW